MHHDGGVARPLSLWVFSSHLGYNVKEVSPPLIGQDNYTPAQFGIDIEVLREYGKVGRVRIET